MVSMQHKTENFLEEVKDAVTTERLLLPSLPDVALKIKAECEKEESSAQKIAEVISRDPALTVRLLQIANSSLYRTRISTDNIQMAITKLGLKLVRDLIISLSMKQLYNAENDVIAERFNELWLASTKTAAIAHLLASQHEHLDAEKAMLAGLTHNIGALPIILMAEDDDELFDQPGTLYKILHKLQGEVGAFIFQKWHFPSYMVDVANECYHFRRNHDGPADYVDVVQVALIQGSIYTGLDCPEDWSTVSAFARMNINTDSHVLDIEENKLVFDETTTLFK
ncbi:MAG: histidine kinase [endosymbiont of Galathealinum brachiosum]|uniref:Histidine kinase n=1 Tax=endosymbiont of Galathealinum brachiosum TaxID=2200906 RepID=A0A370DI28_9GAMM|nr:MAG: histidine kinase [endosymbiont of Galathealinum brachiosum]